MAEDDWLSTTNPGAMLTFLVNKTTNRKLRLFACGCSWLWWKSLGDSHRTILAIGERYADGLASSEEIEHGRRLARQSGPALAAMMLVVIEDIVRAILPAFNHEYDLRVEDRRKYCNLLQEIVGNPFCPLSLEPSWQTPTVRALAQAAYDRASSLTGTIETDRLSVLADALEDAGCADPVILEHLRGPGPHYRGCFVIDAILNKK
jgi:hypothetical protein